LRKFDSKMGLPSIIVKRFHNTFERNGSAKLIFRELNLLNGMRHQNVVRLKAMYTIDKTPKKLKHMYAITLYCGDPLSDVIGVGEYTMSNVKRWTAELLSALQYINLLDIAHRNLNPDNMCIRNGKLTLIGFGKA
ncbi:hypothetical protein PENTCL1PPCAC_8606, partial [Pristionchus entomophagus]